MLSCCTESTAFTSIATKVAEDETITSNTLKIKMKRGFFGDDYCKTFQHKFRELTFRKGINENTFIAELTETI